jgi:hypothetical protein
METKESNKECIQKTQYTKDKQIDNKYKEYVQKTINLLKVHGFIEDTNGSGIPIFYLPIYKNIYVLIRYPNSNNKEYYRHCLDLFISFSNNIDDLRKESILSKFFIGSFNSMNEIHIKIFEELLKPQEKNMSSEALFRYLGCKFWDMFNHLNHTK